jgi:hypothetical protein
MASRTKKKPPEYPEKIIVRGAGTEAANGEYILERRTGKDDDEYKPPVYIMQEATTSKTKTKKNKKQKKEPDTSPESSWRKEIFHCGERWSIGCRSADRSSWISYYETDIMQLDATNSIPPVRGCWWDVEYVGKAGETTSPPIVLPEGRHVLDWRDAAKSDDGLDRWEIQIVDKDTSLETEYSVHSYVLANATDYYKSLLSKDFAEKKEQKSRIELPSDVSRVFSYFLDYIYEYHGTPTNMQPPWAFICPLYWLGRYFGTAYLLDDLMRYLDLDNEMWDVPTWCYGLVASAQRHDIQPILDASAAACAKEILQLGVIDKPDMLAAIDPSFWAGVFTHLSSDPSDGHSVQASLLLAAVCAAGTTLDPALFSTLTSMLPSIDPTAAYALLQKESELTNQYAGMTELTHLQTKCIAAFAWIGLDTSQPELLTQPAMFFLELFRLTHG